MILINQVVNFHNPAMYMPILTQISMLPEVLRDELIYIVAISVSH
jgi:hypothetical protein